MEHLVNHIKTLSNAYADMGFQEACVKKVILKISTYQSIQHLDAVWCVFKNSQLLCFYNYIMNADNQKPVCLQSLPPVEVSHV